MSSEKFHILNMVKENKITVEEGVRLLEKLSYENNASWIKVKILDAQNNLKTDITLPVSLLNIGVKLAEKFSPEFKESGLTQRDLDELYNAIKSGTTGQIINIKNDKGEKVEIIIE